MPIETGITKNEIIAALTKSPHGALSEYVPLGLKAAQQEPEFLAHLIAWNEKKGQIRDSKVALPIISLSANSFPADFISNSFAHLTLLSPRDFARALRFGMAIKTTGHAKGLKRLTERYLRAREDNWAWFERTAIQHRRSLKELYAITHTKPSATADAVLFKGERPRGSVFEAVANLKNMNPAEAAGTIMERRIPFLIAMGALGAKAKEPDLALALIGRMSPTELVTNTKMLERLGVKTNPALRAAFEAGLGRAATAKTSKSRTATFKATAAVEALGGEQDDPLREKLRGLQEKQILTAKRESGIDGDWLVLGDKSGSMQFAIATSRLVAATLAKLVRGAVELVFFDTTPRRIKATGKTYDEIVEETKHVMAQGGTSIGCGLQWAIDNRFDFGGIALVSDGAENNHPQFARAYYEYEKRTGNKPVVYWYRVAGTDYPQHTANFELSCKQVGIDLQVFDLRGGTDHYALTNLITTMRLQRYGLVEEIMDTPLIDLEAILPPLREKVFAV